MLTNILLNSKLAFSLILSGMLFFSNVAAADFDLQINPINVTGLGNSLGKQLHVLYVNGSASGIMTDDRQFNVEKVLDFKSLTITGDSVMVPATTVVVNDFRKPAILFVVTNETQFTWGFSSLSRANSVKKLLWPQYSSFMRNFPGTPIPFDINFGMQ
jgi:hypothetical protein